MKTLPSSTTPTLLSTIERVEAMVESLNRDSGTPLTPYDPITKHWAVGSFFLSVTSGEWFVKKVAGRTGDFRVHFYAKSGVDMERQLTEAGLRCG